MQQYSWVLYIFGAFLIATGIKMLIVPEAEPMCRRTGRGVHAQAHARHGELHDQHFFVKKPDPVTGKLVTWADASFLALVVINVADLIFAVDSVPAIFAITTTPSWSTPPTSWPFSACGRSISRLRRWLHRFEYLKYALALVLVFIGGDLLEPDRRQGGSRHLAGRHGRDDRRRHRLLAVEDARPGKPCEAAE